MSCCAIKGTWSGGGLPNKAALRLARILRLSARIGVANPSLVVRGQQRHLPSEMPCEPVLDAVPGRSEPLTSHASLVELAPLRFDHTLV
jgi:hypothetical protein